MVALAWARLGLPRGRSMESFVEEARGTHAGPLPAELFLAHRAGLEAHGKLWLPLLEGRLVDRSEALRTAATWRRSDLEPTASPPFSPVYSDLGYMLAGEALARATGAPADEVVDEFIASALDARPILGSARLLEARGVPLRDIAAPTEIVPWRDDGLAVRGRVHDENAWALSPDGVQGHAGLFGTALAVLRFGIAVADALGGRASALAPKHGDLRWMVEPRPGGSLRAGFDGKSREGSSAGTVLGPRTFGHLGFTGTSVWIDPDADVVVTLLTNRVHPSRDNVKIRAARPLAHDELAREALRR